MLMKAQEQYDVPRMFEEPRNNVDKLHNFVVLMCKRLNAGWTATLDAF